jgi:hypothetical protein
MPALKTTNLGPLFSGGPKNRPAPSRGPAGSPRPAPPSPRAPRPASRPALSRGAYPRASLLKNNHGATRTPSSSLSLVSLTAGHPFLQHTLNLGIIKHLRLGQEWAVSGAGVCPPAWPPRAEGRLGLSEPALCSREVLANWVGRVWGWRAPPFPPRAERLARPAEQALSRAEPAL